MLCQGKGDNPFLRKDIKTYFYCGKPGYIAYFFYKEKNNDKYNVNNDVHSAIAMQHKNTYEDDVRVDHGFKSNKTHEFSWVVYNTYKIITPCYVRLDDNKVAEECLLLLNHQQKTNKNDVSRITFMCPNCK